MTEETNIFSIRARKTKYSKYAYSLERLFKNNSLLYLQDKLKHPTYFKPKEEKIDDGIKQIKFLKSERTKGSINSFENNNHKDVSPNQSYSKYKRKKVDLQDNKTLVSAEKILSFKELIEISRKIK